MNIPKNFESGNQGGLNIETVDRSAIESIVDPKEFDIEFHGQNIALILAGEEHHNPQDIKLEATLIEAIRPEFVLHEFLSGWIYDPESSEVRLQENRMAYHDITFAESDILEKEIAKENPDRYEYDFLLLDRLNPDEFFTPQHPVIMPYRDRRMKWHESI